MTEIDVEKMNKSIDETLAQFPELDRKTLETFYRISAMSWTAKDALEAFRHVKVK